MAGSAEPPDASGQEAHSTGIPKVKTFSCPQCGASVVIRNPGQSMSVACDSCHSVIDATDENYRILVKYFAQTDSLFAPLIPLGTRGELMGERWAVVGYMVRRDNRSGFIWDEYLLFSPYNGYRWLTEAKGHWSFVTPIKEKPVVHSIVLTGASPVYAELEGNKYRLFYEGHAEVIYVLGEFYWKVTGNEKVYMSDYVSAPEMLSSESSQNEVIWSRSEYLEPGTIQAAFNLKQPLSTPMGLAPNQPSWGTAVWKGIAPIWVVFLIGLTFLECWSCAKASNKTAFSSHYLYKSNEKSPETTTTPVFTLEKEKANLEISFSTDVDNSWFFVSGDLVNNQSGETYPLERAVEYYHGYDGGESWSEGGSSNQLLLSGVPGGQYYLNLDTESGGFKQSAELHDFAITVKRDVPTYANYFWCLFLVSIIPLMSCWRSYWDEVNRWSDSDFTPYKSSSE